MRVLILTWRDLAHPEAGGAEVYTEQVARRWAAKGHAVTVFAASVPGRPGDEMVDGYNVVRRGGRFTVYRAARRWYRTDGAGRFDVVIDMVNTVPFKAHQWVKDVPVIAFFHQTAEECWMFNAPLPVPCWAATCWSRPGSRLTGDAPSWSCHVDRCRPGPIGVRNTVVLPEGFDPVPAPAVVKESDPTVVWCARLVPYKASAGCRGGCPDSAGQQSLTFACGS